MLLGNPDRMPCEALGWRGNPHNILYCRGGTHAGRMVAIDSAVQRRPPGRPLANTPFPCCPDLPGATSCCLHSLAFRLTLQRDWYKSGLMRCPSCTRRREDGFRGCCLQQAD